ncbi:MAG: hypothetical protein LKJ26_06305 [Lentilactobacillus buchneri]|nr:hypothetical protein [Lentilactobacillus buchneri]MCI2019081.1 hypothetical protein [Lentilactobacillus buchneri]
MFVNCKIFEVRREHSSKEGSDAYETYQSFLGDSAFWPDCVNQGDCQYNQSIVDIIRALGELMQAEKRTVINFGELFGPLLGALPLY